MYVELPVPAAPAEHTAKSAVAEGSSPAHADAQVGTRTARSRSIIGCTTWRTVPFFQLATYFGIYKYMNTVIRKEVRLEILCIYEWLSKFWVPYWGPHNKDYSILGVYIRVPLFWETTIP